MKVVIAIVFACLMTHAANRIAAATIVSYEVKSLAASDKPGDTIRALVSLGPHEDGIEVEVRPLVVSGRQFRPVTDKQQPTQPIVVREPVKRAVGPDGKAETVVASVSIDVTFDRFDLPPGRYDFMYELRLVAGERTLAAQPGSISRLVVAAPPAVRVKRLPPEGRARIAEKQAGKGYAVKDGKLVEFDATYTVSKPAPKGSTDPSRADANNGEIERDLNDTTRLPVASLRDFEPQQKRVVYYATNRNLMDAANATVARFGAAISDTVSYGSCRVNIPIQSHQPGDLTTRQYFWQWADPNKFFDVEAVGSLDKAEFCNAIKQGDILLFVHGYYNSFSDAVLRVAQLQHDLQFNGAAVAFSWPSAASVTGYRSDELSNEKSLNSFTDVLEMLIAQLPPDRHLHVIAHSMGNRLLLHGVRKLELEKRLAPDAQPFGSVVLAAPDVPANAFSYLAPRLVAHAARVTYYYATNDLALGASRMNHFDTPAGLRFFYIDGMETVDATHAGVESTNHGYYGASPKLLSDLRMSMILGFAAEKRKPPLDGPLMMEGFPYWAFPGVRNAAQP